MEYRLLGGSGLKVPVLSFGTGTFGGANEFFKAWGSTDVAEATRLVDICLEAGVNLFDTADGYSDGRSEEILGKALEGRRAQVLISTKSGFPTGPGPNDLGSSRHHLRNALEALQGCPGARRDIIVRTTRQAGGDVAVEVCDFGSGVDPGIADRIFHPFQTTKAEGTGLGLAISRSIVQAHEGTLGYRANAPAGTCFFMNLPVGPETSK